jgi:hypothetical protein
MFPWLMPNATMGGNLSLLSMMMGQAGQGAQQNPYGNPLSPSYWPNVNAARQPGASNWDTFMHGILPQSMWPQEWRQGGGSNSQGSSNGDRSGQTDQGNQPDTGNSFAPPGQVPRGGPDNRPMSDYDPNTVSPSPRARNQMLQLGLLGLNMMQPRQAYTPRPF